MEKAFYQILFYLIIAVIIIYFSTRKRKKPAQTQLTSQNASSDSQGDLSKRVDELLDRIDKELSSYKKVGGGEQTDNSLDTPFSTLDNATYEVGTSDTLEGALDTVELSQDVSDISSTQIKSVTDQAYSMTEEKSIHSLLHDFNIRKAIIYAEIVEKKYF